MTSIDPSLGLVCSTSGPGNKEDLEPTSSLERTEHDRDRLSHRSTHYPQFGFFNNNPPSESMGPIFTSSSAVGLQQGTPPILPNQQHHVAQGVFVPNASQPIGNSGSYSHSSIYPSLIAGGTLYAQAPTPVSSGQNPSPFVQAPAPGGHFPQQIPHPHDTWSAYDAMWYQRNENSVLALVAQNHTENRAYNAQWMEFVERKNQETQGHLDEIARLKAEVSHEKKEREKLEEIFNIRGAIETIISFGKNKNKIPVKCTSCQSAIDHIAASKAFQTALKLEAKQRGIDEGKILEFVGILYHELSKHAHGTTGRIVLDHAHHRSVEVAAIATILRTQKGWGTGLRWSEKEKDA